MITSNSLKQTSRAESSLHLHTHFTPYTAWRRATSLTIKLLKPNHFISTLLGWIWILERVSDIITTSRRRICETGFIECYHLTGQLTGDGFTHIRATNRYFSASFPILIASWADLTIWGNFWSLKLKANLNFYSQVRLSFYTSPHSDPRQSCDLDCEQGGLGFAFTHSLLPPLGCTSPSCNQPVRRERQMSPDMTGHDDFPS